MKPDLKRLLLDCAEVFDSFRVVPRFALAAFGALAGWMSVNLTLWYEHLPADQRSANVTAFMGMIFTTLMGASGFVYKVYSDNGRDWNEYRGNDAPGKVAEGSAGRNPGT